MKNLVLLVVTLFVATLVSCSKENEPEYILPGGVGPLTVEYTDILLERKEIKESSQVSYYLYTGTASPERQKFQIRYSWGNKMLDIEYRKPNVYYPTLDGTVLPFPPFGRDMYIPEGVLFEGDWGCWEFNYIMDYNNKGQQVCYLVHDIELTPNTTGKERVLEFKLRYLTTKMSKFKITQPSI